MENVPFETPNPEDNPLIRREAGEGWHPEGIKPELLAALVAREAIVDEIVRQQRESDADPGMQDRYAEQAAQVAELKQQFGITDPPSQMPPDTPGAVE